MESLPSFSIVINTLNRATLLDDAIRGASQLDYPEFELIVVNGPSTDHSEAVLAPWSDRIKLLRCAEANLSISRNVGIAAAAGDIVCFMDDDAVPHPQWLRQLASHYARPRVGGVGGFTVDNSGMRWQVRKTVCDRFGYAHLVDDLFDEDRLNFAGTPFYPSLLGTNSSFRRSALLEIGGFDHAFAYLLDETDVCLRLVDAGWRIVYEPDALVFHQFAESHIRSASHTPKTLYPSVVSKTYFISRHGRVEGGRLQSAALEEYRSDLMRSNKWLAEHQKISNDHRISLDLDVEQGVAAGSKKASTALATDKVRGDLTLAVEGAAFKSLAADNPLRVALVSRGYPPANDTGIARWTGMVARGLADLGVSVHVITAAAGQPSRRYVDGIWHHAIELAEAERARPMIAQYELPPGEIGCWMTAVMHEIRFLKTFGLDIVSFPIWDVEALPVLDDPDLTSVVSLHTTYKLARPFKPEWDLRIVLGRAMVDRVIAAEQHVLDQAPHLLANSTTVIREIEAAYETSLGARATVVPHGTPDLLVKAGITLDQRLAANATRGGLRVLVPGRFELRKGYDLAIRLAHALRDDERIQFDFVGADIDEDMRRHVLAETGVALDALANATFHGKVSRDRLETLYRDCDITMMLSRFESFGLVAIEAMAAGAPVLALEAGALPEVIADGVSGWLLPEDTRFAERAAGLLRALAASRARVEATSGSAYAAYCERFGVAAMARDILAFYRAAIDGSRTEPLSHRPVLHQEGVDS